MFYPKLKAIKEKNVVSDSFGGIYLRPDVPQGLFGDMENMTGDSFPLLRSRNPRGRWSAVLSGTDDEYPGATIPGHGITAVADVGGTLCICADSYVIADGNIINEAVLDSSVKYRSAVPFGKNLFVAPDGEYIVLSGEKPQVLHGNYKFVCTDGAETFFCLDNGSAITPDHTGSFPATAAEGSTALMNDGVKMSLYEKKNGASVFLSDVYIGLRDAGIQEAFSEGDAVHITLGGEMLPDGKYPVKGVSDGILILEGIADKTGKVKGASVEKNIPLMDFAVEHNNRIWGCRYGLNRDGEFVNEIYASALGEPLKWYDFKGISTDSYCATLGCSGEFTGAVALGDEVLFFKEDSIIRVTGNAPSDFCVYSFPARGVEKGDRLSVVNLNEKVFYKSRTGIMVYDGALPVNISEALGNTHFTDSVAGSFCNKYYIAMTDPEGRRSIFVYDTLTGQWYKEDDSGNTRFMVKHSGCLYFAGLKRTFEVIGIPFGQYFFRVHDCTLAPEARNIFSVEDDGEYDYSYISEEPVCWYAVTGKSGADGEGVKKILRGIDLTLSLGEKASLSVSILPDGEHEWKKICFIDTPCDKVFSVPVSTPPCHSFRLKFEGKGDFILHSFSSRWQISGRGINYGQ